MPILTWPGLFALAWWSMNVLSVLVNAPNPWDSLRHVVRLFLMVLTYLTVVNLIHTRRQWHLAVGGFLALSVLESAYGLVVFVLQPMGVRLGLQRGHHVPIWTPYGTLEEGNIFGSHSAAWALMFLVLLLTLWNTRGRWWYLAGLLITGLAAGASLPRAAWIEFAIGAALAFLFYSRQTRTRWRHVALLAGLAPFLLLGLVCLVWVAPPDIPFIGRLRTFSQLGADPTFSARLQNYTLALSEWRQHPWIGWGPGVFYQIHGLIRGAPAWISDLTVRTLYETGLFGALFFYGWVGLSLAMAIGAARGAAVLDRALLLGLAIGFIALLIAYHATDGTWLAAVWVQVGLMVAGARAVRRE
ncbi:MAG: O-antigen ligase family protein, partial [Anaerolineae bacterium]|nr:O-antigen ligase family protein [Anaerolineae bacterium]